MASTAADEVTSAAIPMARGRWLSSACVCALISATTAEIASVAEGMSLMQTL
jgi:hypothetical protein